MCFVLLDIDKWEMCENNDHYRLSENRLVEKLNFLFYIIICTLVTDGTVEWMIDQKEFHDAFPGLASEVRIRLHLPTYKKFQYKMFVSDKSEFISGESKE